MIRWILTKNHTRFYKVILILQTGKIPLYTQTLQRIVEISFQSRMGIYCQWNIKDGR